MAEQVQALATYERIRGCNDQNLPDYYKAHQLISSAGYSILAFYREHLHRVCANIRQFNQEGSTFFPVQYRQTSWRTRKPRS